MTQTTQSIPSQAIEQAQLLVKLMSLGSSLWISQTLHAAVALAIPDALADGSKRADELARELRADAGALERLLRALASLDLVRQDAAGAFALTALGAPLRSAARDSLANSVRLGAGPDALRSWGQLVECVRTGQTAAKLLGGFDEPFASFEGRPRERAAFDTAMAHGTRVMAGAIALAYDFSGIDRIVDVGGGYGALLPPILRAHPKMTGIVLDVGACRAGAQRVFEKTGIADRCEFVEGDFFEGALPGGADVYVLKGVIHDWDDARSLVILRSCRGAMQAASRLLLIEVVVPERLDPSPECQRVAAADLNMLVSTGGRERTEADFRRLFEASGLRLARIVPTLAGVSVIEARPA